MIVVIGIKLEYTNTLLGDETGTKCYREGSGSTFTGDHAKEYGLGPYLVRMAVEMIRVESGRSSEGLNYYWQVSLVCSEHILSRKHTRYL